MWYHKSSLKSFKNSSLFLTLSMRITYWQQEGSLFWSSIPNNWFIPKEILTWSLSTQFKTKINKYIQSSKFLEIVLSDHNCKSHKPTMKFNTMSTNWNKWKIIAFYCYMSVQCHNRTWCKYLWRISVSYTKQVSFQQNNTSLVRYLT